MEYAERFAITFDGESYRFEEYRYDKLLDAVNYAKQQPLKRHSEGGNARAGAKKVLHRQEVLNAEHMDDEELYLEAAHEVESDRKDPALWVKVMALTEGNEEKAKYLYVKLKVEKLTRNKAEETSVVNKKTFDEFDNKYIPVAEYAKNKNITEERIIAMIRDGSYVGQIKDKVWYVSREGTSNVVSSGVTSRSQTSTSVTAKTFDVYHHAAHGNEVVKRGFSWPAFFFTAIWAFVKKMWVHGSILLGVLFVLTFVESGFAQEGSTDGVLVMLVAQLIFYVICGSQGNDWRRVDLVKRGYDKLFAVNAESPDDAIVFAVKKDTG